MKRTLSFLVATAAIGIFGFSNANATAFTQSEAGAPVTMTIAVAGAPNFQFNPSTNVVLDGQSDATSFAIYSYHENVLNKNSGQEYGMTSGVNKIYFLDISSSTAASTPTATDSTAFTGWNQM